MEPIVLTVTPKTKVYHFTRQVESDKDNIFRLYKCQVKYDSEGKAYESPNKNILMCFKNLLSRIINQEFNELGNCQIHIKLEDNPFQDSPLGRHSTIKELSKIKTSVTRYLKQYQVVWDDINSSLAISSYDNDENLEPVTYVFKLKSYEEGKRPCLEDLKQFPNKQKKYHTVAYQRYKDYRNRVLTSPQYQNYLNWCAEKGVKPDKRGMTFEKLEPFIV